MRSCAVSDVLRKLPRHGVGALVTRDTWHPESTKYWEVVEVVPLPVGGDTGGGGQAWHWKSTRSNNISETSNAACAGRPHEGQRMGLQVLAR